MKKNKYLVKIILRKSGISIALFREDKRRKDGGYCLCFCLPQVQIDPHVKVGNMNLLLTPGKYVLRCRGKNIQPYERTFTVSSKGLEIWPVLYSKKQAIIAMLL